MNKEKKMVIGAPGIKSVFKVGKGRKVRCWYTYFPFTYQEEKYLSEKLTGKHLLYLPGQNWNSRALL
jgi:hypothetical protein